MEYPTFTFRPRGTRWIRCEFEAAFDCDHAPSLSSDPKLRITGINAIGFGISHEYEIEAPNIIDVVEEPGDHLEGCSKPRRYSFTLSYRLHDKFGIGFNWGAGTGTFGHRSKSHPGLEHFRTATICCDEGASRKEGATPRYRLQWSGWSEAGLLAVAIIGFGLAAAYHALDGEEARRIYLVVLLGLVIASAAAGWLRRRTLLRTSAPEPGRKQQHL